MTFKKVDRVPGSLVAYFRFIIHAAVNVLKSADHVLLDFLNSMNLIHVAV